jgi:hypothetical protein
MHRNRGARTFRAALIALIGVLVMSVCAASAYAGGRDDGNGPGRQNWVSSQIQQNLQSAQVESQSSSDQSSSDESQSEDHGKHCKKNETSTGEQGKTGEESQQGELGKKQNEEQGNAGPSQGGKKAETGAAPTPAGQTAPAAVTTPAAMTTPAVVPTPAPAPVQAQQAPTQGGEVQGQTEQAPQQSPAGSSPSKRGGRVLAENQITTPTASRSRLAETGFDAWRLALLGAICVATSALLLRRTRRS